jgi:hypothetical protein
MWAMLALGILAVAIVAGAADNEQVREQIHQKRVVLGLSIREVRLAIGEPTKITRTVTYWDTVEDWMYGEGKDAILLTFEGGKLARITERMRTDPK